MTRREFVKAALRFEDTGIVPYEIKFTASAKQKLIEHLGDVNIEKKLGNFVAKIFPESPYSWQEIVPGYVQDEFGVVWNRAIDRDVGVVEEAILTEPSIEGLTLPQLAVEQRFAHYEEFVQNNRGLYLLSGIRYSLFERAWSLRGMQDLLMDMIINPDFVQEMLAKITDYNISLIEQAAKFGIDGVQFGDDWGQQKGLIMGPKLWRQFIKPCLKRMYSRVHELGLDVWIHSCGDITMLLPELIEIGVNVFNPFQPEVMNIYEIKRIYGHRLAFNGGLSIQKVLPFGTLDEVQSEVRILMKYIGKGGGYILGPAHRIPGDVPIENLLVLIDEVIQQDGMEHVM